VIEGGKLIRNESEPGPLV